MAHVLGHVKAIGFCNGLWKWLYLLLKVEYQGKTWSSLPPSPLLPSSAVNAWFHYIFLNSESCTMKSLFGNVLWNRIANRVETLLWGEKTIFSCQPVIHISLAKDNAVLLLFEDRLWFLLVFKGLRIWEGQGRCSGLCGTWGDTGTLSHVYSGHVIYTLVCAWLALFKYPLKTKIVSKYSCSII